MTYGMNPGKVYPVGYDAMKRGDREEMFCVLHHAQNSGCIEQVKGTGKPATLKIGDNEFPVTSTIDGVIQLIRVGNQERGLVFAEPAPR